MHTLLLANNSLCCLEFFKEFRQRIRSFTYYVIKVKILKGLRERHKHDIDLGFPVDLCSYDLQLVQMSDHLQNIFLDWGSFGHLSIE